MPRKLSVTPPRQTNDTRAQVAALSQLIPEDSTPTATEALGRWRRTTPCWISRQEQTQSLYVVALLDNGTGELVGRDGGCSIVLAAERREQ